MSQQINLYNPLLEPRREWMSFNVAATVVLATLALVALGSSAASWRYNTLVRQEQASSQRLANAKEEMTRLANQLSSRQTDPQLLAELDRAKAELKSRDEMVAVLQGGVMGNTAGYSEYLRAFARQSIEGLWLTGFSITGAGHHVVIEGRTLRADLVPDYL
ncbi:MAG TPA: MSHA biogenesis protein MshI, partial [Burkholderiales bacterium]|nr:MSHA biogenesis protein MshI [Burkholderiales bacterium]